MKYCLFFVCWIISLQLNLEVTAQTLTEKLKAEDPARLALDAREKGNIVRGAILYHQGNINCAKCHRASASLDRFGPNLSELPADTPDQSIITSILSPSQDIREGFETMVASTLDGQVHYGLVVEKDSDKLVLRDQANIDRLITIPKEELDELQVGRKSMMPEGLADQLANRQQFLDLLRYVIDVKERGVDVDVTETNQPRQRRLSPNLEARLLMHENQCSNCHAGTSLAGIVSDKKPPSLTHVAGQSDPAYLQAFIADPQSTKPETAMPHTLEHLNAQERNMAAEAITHFLVSVSEPIEDSVSPDSTAIQRGHELYQTIGCIACHAPRDQTGNATDLDDDVIPLEHVSKKFSLEGLVAFLEDPLKTRSSGRMPNMQLTHFEAIDLANFLLQSDIEKSPQWSLDPEKAVQGKQKFMDLGCNRCHEDPMGRPGPSTISSGMSALQPGRGCLSAPEARNTVDASTPNFHFSESERKLLNTFISNHARENLALTDNDRIELNLRAFNCIACHDRGQLGGVTDARNPHFKTDNLNLGDQGRIPPTLTGVGAKLKPRWMRDVLVNARKIRPYMNTRMPQYGASNVEQLVDAFQNADHLAESIEYSPFDDQKAMRELGRTLVGNKGLNCVACHTYQYKLSDTMPAVDLTEMAERLKKDWFYDYMLHPQRYSPNTVMPSFWPNGQAIRTDLEGDSGHQIEAIWQYLLDGRQAPMPEGVVRKPMEIVVTDKARMLRRKYPDIGKRGIGVGYPGDVNIAYDAEHLRLALIWRGKFVDPSGVWRGQGSGEVRPLGRTIRFAKGPDLYLEKTPWQDDGGRPPTHRFRGYSLDQAEQPTFQYSIGDVSVREKFEPVTKTESEKAQLRRTVGIKTGGEPQSLRFRIAESPTITAKENGIYELENGLQIKIAHTAPIQITETEGGMKQLQISIDAQVGSEHKLIFEYLMP